MRRCEFCGSELSTGASYRTHKSRYHRNQKSDDVIKANYDDVTSEPDDVTSESEPGPLSPESDAELETSAPFDEASDSGGNGSVLWVALSLALVVLILWYARGQRPKKDDAATNSIPPLRTVPNNLAERKLAEGDEILSGLAAY